MAQRKAANGKLAPVSQKKGTAGSAQATGQAAEVLARAEARVRADGLAAAPAEDLMDLIEEMTAQMMQAAEELKFELAGRLRDEIADLKKELRQMQQAGHA